jgi:hypothetical protein
LLVALIAAQYFVPAVSPVRETVTAWKFESVDPSNVAVVKLLGVPLDPPLVHQVDVARSHAAW